MLSVEVVLAVAGVAGVAAVVVVAADAGFREVLISLIEAKELVSPESAMPIASPSKFITNPPAFDFDTFKSML